MVYLRRVRTKQLKTFGEFSESFLAMILSICKNASRIDLIFDTFMEGSVKDTERLRRSKSKAIEFSKIREDTLLSVEMETFWESISNNAYVQSQAIPFVLNGMAQELQIILCQSAKNGKVETFPESNNNFEVADVRLIPHVIHAVLAGTERIVILSRDTDVLIITLYFWNLFNSHGLRQFWMRAGVSDPTRHIPLHSLAKK